ncbi:MAG: hypothetical protein M0Z31_05900 [Clostridia bacterium]|nr:hypothetical protein [Clostridia bacterium]
METSVLRVGRLFIGLFLYAVGIVMTINANLGLSPWDVFHQGLSNITGITMGQASILVGFVLVIIDALLGERIGWGTLSNMLFIGLFIDFFLINKLIPTFQGFIPSLIMMSAGMFIIGVGSCFYMGVGLGSGPRDGLMVVLTKRTGKSVGFIRNSIETGVLVMGYLLGGSVGIGTLFAALTLGSFVQLAFRILKFDMSSVNHRFIDQDLKLIYGILGQKQ